MLTYLHVKNFALIKELEIEMTQGLTVLTGETGAGKSIVIGSMNAIAGEKLEKEVIRRGEDYVLIEMMFVLPKEQLKNIYETYGIEYDDPQEILLSRRFNDTGRSIFRVNNQTVTTQVMKEIADLAIDIHSQHEHQSLLLPSKHIDLLDEYLGNRISPYLLELDRLLRELKICQKAMKGGQGNDELRLREMDFLRFEIHEIEEAKLQPNEDLELEAEYKLLSNRQKILKNMAALDMVLQNDQDSNIHDMIGHVASLLSQIENYDPKIKEFLEQAYAIESLVKELGRAVEHYSEDLELDHHSLDTIEKRLHLINTLKHKYGESVEAILKTYQAKSDQLENLENYDKNLQIYKEQSLQLNQEILSVCRQLHEIRLQGAEEIGEKITMGLKDLNFEHGKVSVSVETLDDYNQKGSDQVTILIGTNLNEPVQPLNKIASGGELSRVMLAIKSVFAELDMIDTLVFDEIDTGISGRTAQKVAEKMVGLSTRRQIICITHLPQIAAMADSHYLIEKHEEGGRIETALHKLDDNQVHDELARLIGGATITKNTLEAAKEMKELANRLKSKG